jgi:AICAR transformylase/IMP cyclohydrolase PurH
MIDCKRALISVSDKEDIIDFAKELSKLNIEILSTGGTATVLRDAGIRIKEVSEVTGFPEMLDGRVKTLHSIIHAGILAKRDEKEHMGALKKHKIECKNHTKAKCKYGESHRKHRYRWSYTHKSCCKKLQRCHCYYKQKTI